MFMHTGCVQDAYSTIPCKTGTVEGWFVDVCMEPYMFMQ